MYNNIGLEPVWTYRVKLCIGNLGKWNSVKWNETRRTGAIFACFYVARVWQRQLGFLVSVYYQKSNFLTNFKTVRGWQNVYTSVVVGSRGQRVWTESVQHDSSSATTRCQHWPEGMWLWWSTPLYTYSSVNTHIRHARLDLKRRTSINGPIRLPARNTPTCSVVRLRYCCSLSVRPSVTLVNCDHILWDRRKVI